MDIGYSLDLKQWEIVKTQTKERIEACMVRVESARHIAVCLVAQLAIIESIHLRTSIVSI